MPIDGDGVLVALADVGLDFTPERGLALLQELALAGRSRLLVVRYSELAQ